MTNSRFLATLLGVTMPLTALAGPPLTREVPAGMFRKDSISVKRELKLPDLSGTRPSKREIRKTAEGIARLGLPYVFGGSSTDNGGMDCSGSIQYLLKSLGYQNVPRTSFAQYEWVKNNERMKRGKTLSEKNLNPGDLIFWGGTYRSGHKVSHVMMYMGQGTDGKLYMYGARGTQKSGVSGAGVDIFELRPGKHDNLVGYGQLPKR